MNRNHNKTGTLFFDLDNTLINRDAAFSRYAADLAARHPGAFHRADNDRLQQLITLDQRGRKSRAEFCQELLGLYPRLPYSPEELWEDHRRLPGFVEADPQVIELLSRLSGRFHLFTVSNGSGVMQREKIHRAGISAFFEQIFISGERGCAKPEPAFFELALAACPALPVVMIGDDYKNDILPAVLLSLKTIWIRPDPDQDETDVTVEPDQQISTIHQLEEALRCIL